jgi:hypothetical protein
VARSKASLALDNKILSALKRGSLSTKALAQTLAEDKGKIYRHCRRLEDNGSLASILAPDTLLLYCVDDDKVVAGVDYENCKKEKHELRSFYNDQRI